MVEPPFEAGATNVTVALAFPAVATTPVGAPGTFSGVTCADAVDAAPVPFAFAAVTENVYARPFVSPLTTIACPLEDVPLNPPGDDVAV